MASVLPGVCIFQDHLAKIQEEQEEAGYTLDSCSFSFRLAFEKCLFRAMFIKILILQFVPFLSDMQLIKV